MKIRWRTSSGRAAGCVGKFVISALVGVGSFVVLILLHGLAYGQPAQGWRPGLGISLHGSGGLLDRLTLERPDLYAERGAGDLLLAQAPEPAPKPPREVTPVAPTTPPSGPTQGDRPASEKPREALLLERGAILLAPGTLQIEPSFEWSRFTANRVVINGFTVFEAIVIGSIRVDRLDRDIYTEAVTLRYGLLPRVQLETRVPFIQRKDEEIIQVGTNAESSRTITGSGIGDVEGSILYQPIIGQGAIPDVILRLRGKSRTGKDSFDISTETVGAGDVRLTEAPTGSGFYSAGPGVTFVWRTDPVVLFAGGGYTFNLERSIGGATGDIDPGDVVDLFAGLNFAINERVSMNMSFIIQDQAKTERNGVKVRGTDFTDARLSFGTSVTIAPNMSLLMAVAIGLSEQSPDFQLTISFPITFNLFR
ncbi:MAG: hypothetical protein HYZ11_06100 [Candidatus Tectomicrobia bacterium]|uniref:Transporter n=1 Tax=Tectimicrobiota bacterium TaxID=2528274 RepID=A0A932HX19_UNCTE|nr:hypothetical protein [Candidatus Tectomicrobia bacterium]